MSAGEIAYRVKLALRSSAERIGIGLAEFAPITAGAGKPWIPELPTAFDRLNYEVAADKILAGTFSLFALEAVVLGFPPEWNKDPKTGTRAPMSFGKALDYRNSRIVGDIKYLWELNRHLDLLTVAQAWHLTRSEKYSMGFRVLLQSWIEQCPYPLGPNWTSGLELGIRLVNWAFAWHLLGGDASPVFAGVKGAAFKALWLKSIYEHCHFIDGHPSLHSSANNHRLGEQLGLFVAATTWPNWAEATRWRESAHDVFESESLRQNAPDGVNREQAIWYQHEVADMMLIAGLLGAANGTPFSEAFWARLEAMLGFIASLMDVGGNVPAIGDSDDAVIVRFVPNRSFNVYRSLLTTGAVLFRRPDFKVKSPVFDDKTRWLLGDSACFRFGQVPDKPEHCCDRVEFPDGGYYIMGCNFMQPNEIRIVADAGPLGYQTIAAHGHADALSIVMSIAGQEMLIDPGTFAYHTMEEWREYFRGTSAHNTVRVDGQDQSLQRGKFMWFRHANARAEQFVRDDDMQRLVMSHDGYSRLKGGVTHRRTVTFAPGTRTVNVDDLVVGEGGHSIECLWHFAEKCDVQLHDDFALVTNGEAGLRLAWPKGSVAKLACGQESPPLGWQSRSFDLRVPCKTLVIGARMERQWGGTTEIQVVALA